MVLTASCTPEDDPRLFRRQSASCFSDAGKVPLPANKRLHDNFAPRTPNMPPPELGALGVDSHDLFILMAVNTVIELDGHPPSMAIRPVSQQNEIGYLKSDAY